MVFGSRRRPDYGYLFAICNLRTRELCFPRGWMRAIAPRYGWWSLGAGLLIAMGCQRYAPEVVSDTFFPNAYGSLAAATFVLALKAAAEAVAEPAAREAPGEALSADVLASGVPRVMTVQVPEDAPIDGDAAPRLALGIPMLDAAGVRCAACLVF